MNNFIEENRFYSDNEYLTRTAYFKADENVNLEKLNVINFYKLLQYKEKLKDKKYLGLLFNFKNIKTSDFREFSKNELLKYVEKQLIDLIDLEMEVYEIGDKELKFDNFDEVLKYCKHNVKQIQQEKDKIEKWFLYFKDTLMQSDKYYLLDREWFKFGDERVFEIEYLSYVIYIFVICFSENKIFTYELSWD